MEPLPRSPTGRRPSSGTSAASTRVIHGGLRYLENGEFRLVREALRPLEDDAFMLEAEEIAFLAPPKKSEPQPSPALEPVFAAERAVPIHAVPPVRELAARVVHG